MLELNKLYNMDCMQGMKEFPDGFFDLAISDPPYGITRFMRSDCAAYKTPSRLRKYGSMETVNRWIPTPEYFKELFRIAKHSIIWGYNHLSDMLPPCTEFICWYKHQPVENFSDAELAWTDFGKVARVIDLPYFGSINADPDGRIHPTQKPVKLYKLILQRYAKDGFRVLDTHAGSCSSLIACHDMGCDFVGFEINEEFYKKAIDRMEAHFAQLTFF